jgi:hypothetical protein
MAGCSFSRTQSRDFFIRQAQKMEINTICPAWCLANGISVELSGEIC